MSKEEKEWTFVDDEGFLMMSKDTAHYNIKRNAIEDELCPTLTLDYSDSSGSETEFEVISKKKSAKKSPEDQVDFIKIKEDHFLHPAPVDCADDGSDIEVIKETSVLPVLIDAENASLDASTFELVSNGTTDGVHVLFENVSDVSTIVEDDSVFDSVQDIGALFEEKDAIVVGGNVSTMPNINMSLSDMWLDEFGDAFDSSTDDLHIDWLFRKSCVEADSELSVTSKDSLGDDDLEYQQHSPKAFTIVFVICASIALGCMVGQGMVGTPKATIPNTAVVQSNLAAKQVAEHVEDITVSTPRKEALVKKKQSSISLIHAWKTGARSTGCWNVQTAYRNLEMKYSTLERELRALRKEYRLFRIHALLLKQGKIQQRRTMTDKRETQPLQRTAPIPPAKINGDFTWASGTARDATNAHSQPEMQLAKEEILNLKRENIRQRRKAGIWRQRYLSSQATTSFRSQSKCESKGHPVFFKTCLDKMGLLFNLSDLFKDDRNTGLHHKTRFYLKWIQSKASCGLKGFSEHFDYLWRRLKGRWTCSGKQKENEASFHDRSAKKRDTKEDPKIFDSDAVKPPQSKWARFRRILRISNVVGAVKRALPRRLYKSSKKDIEKPAQVKGQLSSSGRCLKESGQRNCLDLFKKRWNFNWPKETKSYDFVRDGSENNLQEVQEIKGLSPLPDNFEISYPLPLFMEPQMFDRDNGQRNTASKAYGSDNVKLDSVDAGIENCKKEKPNGKLKPKQTTEEEHGRFLSLAKLRKLGSQIYKELEQKIKEKIKYNKAEQREKMTDGLAKHQKQRNAEDASNLSFFKMEIANVERLIKQYSNKLRNEKESYKEQLRNVEETHRVKREELKRDRSRFSAWALQERLFIFQEIARNTRNFEQTLISIKKWKRALVDKIKRKKQIIKSWLKDKVKQLFQDVEEAKKKGEQENAKLGGKWRKQQLEKMRKALKEEKQKMKSVHKYYKYSLQKAKQRLKEEKKVYESAKARAEELLRTYESLIRKLQEKQTHYSSNGERNEKNGASLRSQSDPLVYPTVFCPDQKSCATQEVGLSFGEQPSVLCPDHTSCMDSKFHEQEPVSIKRSKTYGKRVKRSFRTRRSSSVHVGSASKPTRSRRYSDLISTQTKKQKARSVGHINLTRKKRVENSVYKSVYQLLKQLRSTQGHYVKCKGTCKGKGVGLFKEEGKFEPSVGLKWNGPIAYPGVTYQKPELKRPSSVIWKGPIKYSLRVLPLPASRLFSVPHLPSTAATHDLSPKSQGQLLKVVKDISTTTQEFSGAQHLPSVLYKDSLPRHFPLVNSSSVGDEGAFDEVNPAPERNDDLPPKIQEVPHYAMPYNWYLRYIKGREEVRLLEGEEQGREKDLDWYLALATGRKHFREKATLGRKMEEPHKENEEKVLFSSNDNWYLRMMLERDAQRSQKHGSLNDDWYFRMMNHRRVKDDDTENWYLRQMKWKQREREQRDTHDDTDINDDDDDDAYKVFDRRSRGWYAKSSGRGKYGSKHCRYD